MAITGKQRLQTILDGGVPDFPPHWELVFQIPDALFGMNPSKVPGIDSDTQSVRDEAACNFHAEIADRLISECGWAAVPARNSYAPAEIAIAKRQFGDRALVPGYEGGGVFWMMDGAGMAELARKMFEEPDELMQEARRKCEHGKNQLRLMADAGADFFVLAYDFGFNDAPFVSPRHFAYLCAPFLSEMVQAAHDLGKRVILHSDGCLNLILDQIYSTGLDGYQSVDPQGHMDIKQVREKYPDLILMGNVPCNLLQDDDPDAIRSAVDLCMTEGGIGKKYIFSSSNCIFNGMPAESYRTMLGEYRRLEKSCNASADDNRP